MMVEISAVETLTTPTCGVETPFVGAAAASRP
jgi:hypothetical protein